MVYIVDVKMSRGRTQTQGWGTYEVHGPTMISVESENPDKRRHAGIDWKGCTPSLTSNREEADEFFDKRDEQMRSGETTIE